MNLPAGFALHTAWRPLSLDALVPVITWQQTTVRVYGREHATPRLTAWMGDGGYTYSGIYHAPAPLPAELERLTRELEALTGARFNSVLANYYRNGRDSVAWHADDEPELGTEPTIASVSIGAARVFSVRENEGPGRWQLPLGGGDLLVMRGRSQADYQHAVPKTAKVVGPRINLTFRHVA